MISSPRTRWLWIWGAGYAALIAIVVMTMVSVRARGLVKLSEPHSVESWQAWRDDVRAQQQSPHAVQRRVPQSSEPPLLVLLRNHFPVLMFGAILFSSVLYVVMAWLITGVLSSRGG